MADFPRDKTFSQFHKIDDHANDVHDYLKYLKFGYGRGTDHATQEIRCGRMTREEGIELVEKYDSVKPSSLNFYLDFLDYTEDELIEMIEPMRDETIWSKNNDGTWQVDDCITNHVEDSQVEESRLALVNGKDRTFGVNNEGYYCEKGSVKPVEVDDELVSSKNNKGFITL